MKDKKEWYLHSLPELVYNVIRNEFRPLSVHQIREILVDGDREYKNKALLQGLSIQKIVGAILSKKRLFRKTGTSRRGNITLWGLNIPTYNQLNNRMEAISILNSIDDTLDYADFDNMGKDEMIAVMNEVLGLVNEAKILLEDK